MMGSTILTLTGKVFHESRTSIKEYIILQYTEDWKAHLVKHGEREPHTCRASFPPFGESRAGAPLKVHLWSRVSSCMELVCDAIRFVPFRSYPDLFIVNCCNLPSVHIATHSYSISLLLFSVLHALCHHTSLGYITSPFLRTFADLDACNFPALLN